MISGQGPSEYCHKLGKVQWTTRIGNKMPLGEFKIVRKKGKWSWNWTDTGVPVTINDDCTT